LFVDNLLRFSGSKVKQEISKQNIFPWKRKMFFFACYASKRNRKNLKQNICKTKHKVEQNKKCKQINAEKPIWKQREKFEAKLGNFSF
jgi:hypothetical protein